MSTADLRTLLAFGDRTLDVRRFDETRTVLLAGVSAVVGGDAATLTHLDLRTGREVVVTWPGTRPDPVVLEAYGRLGSHHPLRPVLAAQADARTAAPVRISEVQGLRQWRRSALHHTSHRGVDDQMSVVLARRGTVVHAVTLARHRGTFSDRQRELLGAGHREVGRGELSHRERQVVQLVATGLTDAQVAARLGVRPATVSKHLSRVCARLGLPNRAAAVDHWHQVTAAAGAGESSSSAG